MPYRERVYVASASHTTSGQTETIASLAVGAWLQNAQRTKFYLNVSAVTGTNPTLDIVIESLIGGIWYEEEAFTQATGVTKEGISVIALPCDMRIRWTIAGTDPDFTFQVAMVRF